MTGIKVRSKKDERFQIKYRIHLLFTLAALALIAMTTATYAWFSLSAKVKVNQLEMEISSGPILRIDTVNHGDDYEQYKSEVTLDMVSAQISEKFGVLFDDIALQPLTTGNCINYYTQRANIRGEAANEPNAGGYIMYDLYLISDKDMWVHLTSENSLNGKVDGTAILPLDADAEKTQITQCIRVSFTMENGDVLVYEPNKNGDTQLLGRAAQESANGILNSIDLPTSENMDYTNHTRLLKLTANKVQKVTVRIWAEGEDAQCTNAVQKARFLARFKFQGTDDLNVPLS